MIFEPIWGAAIAWYLFLAGLGAGAFITSAFLGWKLPALRRMRNVGYVVAPIVVVVGLLLLMVDAEGGLRNPLRFALLLTNFGSVMTWGVVFLAGFTVLSLAALVLVFLRRSIPRWIDVVGSVLGVAVAMYTGALLGVCQTFPLWNSALLPILFLVSALSTGAALVLLVGSVRYAEEFDGAGLLKKCHFYLPLAELVLIAALLFVTGNGASAGTASVAALLSGKYALAFWLGLVVVGLVGPTIVEGWMLFRAAPGFEETPRGRHVACAADAGLLVGGFLLRFLIVVAALPLTISVPVM